MVTLNEMLLVINAFCCAGSSIVMGTYQRRGAQHRPLAALFAWLLIVANGSVTILTLTGQYSTANPAETTINVALFIALISSRGNVRQLFRGITRS